MAASFHSAVVPSGYRALLRRRNFVLFFAAFSISTPGTAAVPIAVSFALLGAGYSASAVGAALAAQTPAAASAPLSMTPQKATWGLIAAATGVAGIAGGLLVLHVHIPRPLLAVQLATALLATPLVMLALHAPVPLLASAVRRSAWHSRW